jgi:hypothetical protein
MSPRDSFEFRLKSRTECRSSLCFDIPTDVKKGLSYQVCGADCISPKDKEFRAFVEDDNRYRVHWGCFVKSESGTFSGSLMFIPKDPLPHMHHFCSQTKTLHPETGSQAPLENARKLRLDTDVKLSSVIAQCRKELGPLCLKTSPKESFTFRLQSSFLFKDGLFVEDSNGCQDGLSHQFDAESFFVDNPDFKGFVEDDSRYDVSWVNVVRSNDNRRCRGTIIFKLKDTLILHNAQKVASNSRSRHPAFSGKIVNEVSETWEEYIRKLPRWQHEVL